MTRELPKSIDDAVFEVADAMLAGGQEPSVRKIVARLSPGGAGILPPA